MNMINDKYENWHYGDVLRELRLQREMNQGDLARGITSQSTLSRYESGERGIEADILFKLLKRLRVHPTEFFSLSENDDMHEWGNFWKLYGAAIRNQTDKNALVQREQILYNETNDNRHQLNKAMIEAVFAKKNNLDVQHFKNEFSWLIAYFDNLERWYVSDLEIYIGIMFVFSPGTLHKYHRRVKEGLENLPFAEYRKQRLRFEYANNALILLFENLDIARVPDYLQELDKSISSEADDIYRVMMYNFFQKLYEISTCFNEDEYFDLLKELAIFKKYRYKKEYEWAEKLMKRTVNKVWKRNY